MSFFQTVSRKLSPSKIAPRSGSGFGLRLALELGLGGGGGGPAIFLDPFKQLIQHFNDKISCTFSEFVNLLNRDNIRLCKCINFFLISKKPRLIFDNGTKFPFFKRSISLNCYYNTISRRFLMTVFKSKYRNGIIGISV